MRKKQKIFDNFHSQLDLPFLETDEAFLKNIFETLRTNFNLTKKSNQIFIDLGSGNGSVVIYAALNYNIKSNGIEINQTLVREAKNRKKSLSKEGIYEKWIIKKIKFKLGDFFSYNLKKYDFIYIYSLPSMQKYLRHVFNTAKRGAIIISHKYNLENFSPNLKFEHELAHKKGKDLLFTFFYKKIV
ncbi:MAG: methyltransferase domain-containing protein [Promethearchaeota archaeon]